MPFVIGPREPVYHRSHHCKTCHHNIHPVRWILNTMKHRESHTYGIDSVLSNAPTLLRPDANIEDEKTELSHGALVNLNTDTSADDKCVLMEERTSSLQPGEVMDILETDTNDDWDAMYNTLLGEISPSDASAFIPELPFNPDLDQMDEEGYTQLYRAALEGDLEGVQDLISRGANPNKPSEGGLSPLHAAAQEGHAHIVDFLILQGADVNVECELGQTPLHTSASSGYTCIIDSLIAEGANVNKESNTGWTPFNAAVQYGQVEAVKYLMTKGAKQSRYYGMAPLYAAAQLGHLDIVKFFISKRTDVNEENDNGTIPLHGAASGGHVKVMEYLVRQGSDVNKENNTGWTPFNAAVQYGHLEAVKYLMTVGGMQNRYDGMTPLYDAARKGHLDIVEFFTSNGADVNEENDSGMIALHVGAGGGHLKVMEYLIQIGSDVNKADAKGWTPFNAAVQNGHLEAVKYLVTKGTKQNRCDGMTPLCAAIYFGHLDIVDFFIFKRADVNEEDGEGMFPLHDTAAQDHIEEHKDGGRSVPSNTPASLRRETAREDCHPELSHGTPVFHVTNAFADMLAENMERLDIISPSDSNAKLELPFNPDIDQMDKEGYTQLYKAALEGHLEGVDNLISRGANPNKTK